MTIGGFSDISFLYRPYDAYRIPTADTQKSETLGQNITSKQQAVVPEAPVAKAEEATVPQERLLLLPWQKKQPFLWNERIQLWKMFLSHS